MQNTNLFKSMKDDNLEKCYHNLISIEIKQNSNPDVLSDIIKQYQNNYNEKAGFPIMKNDLLMEIAKRWCECYKYKF